MVKLRGNFSLINFVMKWFLTYQLVTFAALSKEPLQFTMIYTKLQSLGENRHW